MRRLIKGRLIYQKIFYYDVLGAIVFFVLLSLIDLFYVFHWSRNSLVYIIGTTCIVGILSLANTFKENLNNQLITLPVTRSEIWFAKNFLFIFPLLIVSISTLLLSLFFPQHTFNDFLDILSVILFFGSLYYLIVSIINIKYVIIVKSNWKEYTLYSFILIVYIGIILFFGYVIDKTTIVSNNFIILTWFGIIFVITLIVDYLSFKKRKTYLIMF